MNQIAVKDKAKPCRVFSGCCFLPWPRSLLTPSFKILTGALKPDSGKIEWGSRLRLGVFSQEGEELEPTLSPLELCKEIHSDERWIVTILSCLKVRAEKLHRPLGAMSAGERAKVSIARLLLGKPNLLILDEPTNHLDIESRETLAAYPGTILFVSHDRCFIEALADRILTL